MKIRHFGYALAGAALVSVSGMVNAATLKMAIGDAQGGTQWELASAFKKAVEEKTNKKTKVRLFPNGQLGSEEDTVNNAAIGTLDMSLLAINNLAPFSPSLGVLTLPYIVRSADELRTVLEGDIGRELVENTVRDAKVRIVGWTYSGFRVLTNSKRPIKNLNDLKGLVVRVPKNPVMIDTYKSWGINPSPLSWSETFTALQQRVVDGQDTPYSTVAAMKFNEVQKYITPLHFLFLVEPLVIGESRFQRLKPDVQKVILDAGQEATRHSFAYLKEAEEKAKKELVSKGMEIVPLDDEKPWIDAAVSKVWPAFQDKVGGKEKVDAIQKALGR